MPNTIHAVDLFCGAGGTSTGLALACQDLGREVDLLAINHWKQAVESHAANHPWARHICDDVRTVDPVKEIPGGKVDILWGSPECTWLSRAAGGKPRLNQNRATAWDMLRWPEMLYVRSMIIENVQEFIQWGPRNAKGEIIKSKKGETFKAFVHVIRSMGYNVDYRVLNAADYGAATSRSRFFLIAHKGNQPVTWPEPTHQKKANGLPKWRAAREVIDWSLRGKSIFNREHPLSDATVRRIVEGLRRFGGEQLQPFLVLMEHGGGTRNVEDPLPTITTAKGGSMAVVDFTLSQGSGGAPRSLDDPLSTITTDGAISKIDAVLVPSHGERKGQRARAHSTENPTPTIAATGHIGLAEGCLLPVRGFFGQNTAKSLDEPLGTVTQRGYGGVVEPYIVRFNGTDDAAIARNVSSIEDPIGTVTAANRFALTEGFLTQYNGASGARSINEPLGTVTTKDRFALVQPEINGMRLDILFRMLQPHELAAAMGFPASYAFTGTKTQIVKQIGNAVEVNTARALVSSLLSPDIRRGRLAA